mgnify:CR=1 FL=1
MVHSTWKKKEGNFFLFFKIFEMYFLSYSLITECDTHSNISNLIFNNSIT